MPEGLDHRVTVRDDGTVLRHVLADGDGLDVTSEAELLRVVRDRVSLPVPRVLRTWPTRGLMEMERVPGAPLLGDLADLDHQRAVRLAALLGDFVVSVASVPGEEVAHLVPVDLPQPLELIAEAARTAARADVLRLVPAASRAALDAFLDTEPDLGEPPAPLLVHGDLGAEHVFVDDRGIVTGVIDWSDAVLGDPALDLGLVLRDLGPSAGESAVARCAAHGLDAAGLLPRAYFHAQVRALEDLAHGVDADEPAYRDNALRAIARLF